jgi:hypothetical protein
LWVIDAEYFQKPAITLFMTVDGHNAETAYILSPRSG